MASSKKQVSSIKQEPKAKVKTVRKATVTKKTVAKKTLVKPKAVNKEPKVKKEVIKDGVDKEASFTASETAEEQETIVAKAGKRSTKAIKEAEEKEAKELRKVELKAKSAEPLGEGGPKHTQKPPRSRLERRGKNFRKLAELIDKNKTYSVAEACELAIKTSPSKFDATVEMHVNLGVDPKIADQNVRDTLVLPAGSGKNVRIAVFAEADEAKAALAAGADIAGHEDLLKQIEKGVIAFDILIAKPTLMAQLGKLAKILGPKGLMPNPKSGTVTNDVVKAVEQAKAGRVEYRVDSTGIIHLGAGKVSFGAKKLQQNIEAVMSSIASNKPASVKGVYIKSAYLTTTMGPSIKLTV